MKALQAEKGFVASALERSEACVQAVGKQVEEMTEALAVMARAFEALAQTDEQMATLREQATTARTTIADQTVALRLSLSHATDALPAQSVAVQTVEVSESDLLEDAPDRQAGR